MKQISFLYADSWGVNRMSKNLGLVKKGEIPIKVEVEIEESAFREPIVEKKILVSDWRQGVDIADVDFKETFITEEEAAKIRQMRFEKMSEILKGQGYEIVAPLKETN